MNRLKLYAGIILVFILGALTGSLGTGIYFKHRIEKFGPPGPSARKAFLMKKFSGELNLTEAQQVEIKKILDQLDTKIYDIMRKNRPEIEKIMDDSIVLMKDKLNNEQKQKLDELHKKMKEYWRRKDRWFGPPSGWFHQLVVKDLDGDNKKEIIVIIGDKLHVITTGGTEMSGFPVGLMPPSAKE